VEDKVEVSSPTAADAIVLDALLLLVPPIALALHNSDLLISLLIFIDIVTVTVVVIVA